MNKAVGAMKTQLKMVVSALSVCFAISVFADILQGKSSNDCRIVLPSDANSVEQFAAKELAEHWTKTTGGAVLIVTNTIADAGKCFRIGRAAPLDLTGIDVNDARVQIGTDMVVDIAGIDGDGQAMDNATSAGTLFGVYSFLERKLGVRWLWPGELGTVCPKIEIADIAPDGWTVRHMAFSQWRPSMKAGHPGWSDKNVARRFYQDQALWLRRHRFAACDKLAKGHAFMSWYRDYGKKHPEWFNELPDGKRKGDPFYLGGRTDMISLCVTDTNLVKEIVRRWSVENRGNTINGNENDTAGKCCCANCLAADATGDDAGRRGRALAYYQAGSNQWWRALGSVSTRYAKFYKALLDEGRKVRADCRVVAGIYANYSESPASGIELGGNVILRFCPPVMYPWTDEKISKFKNLWEGWSATGAKLMMRPNFTLAGHNFPLVYYRHFADCYDFIRKRGLEAVDMDSLTGVFGANGLTTYVIASKNSDPERSLESLEEDYFSAFGSARQIIRECFAMFQKASDGGFLPDGSNATIEGGDWCDFFMSAHRVFPSEMLEAACGRIGSAMNREADEQVLRRLEFVKTGLEDALLVMKAQKGFAKYKESNDRSEFSLAYKQLIEFRKAKERLGYLNLAFADYLESRHWPRHLAMLSDNARELEGWELNLSPDKKILKWNKIDKMKHWRADYKDVGWYRCVFNLEEADVRNYGRLVFGAVDGDPVVYLNGTVIQNGHPVSDLKLAWRTPFAVEAKEAFKVGRNELLIKLDKKTPGRRGVNRPVYLD